MSDDLRTMLLEQVERLLADRADATTLRAAERDEWPAALWTELEALGLPLAMAPETLGGAGLGWADAVAVWQVLGRHGAPVPLAASMAAAALLGAAGIAPPAGLLALVVPGEAVPWGRRAAGLVTDGALHVPAKWDHGHDPFSREPADRPRPSIGGPAEAALLAGALVNAAQTAGALQAALAMAVDYANTRKQFGRLIGGFQAVQQQLAVCAAQVAITGVAVATAGRAADRRGLTGAAFEIASAKVVCGEAAGTGAAIAHQVFAAIGFTDDHPLHLFTRRMWAWRDGCGAERLWARRIGEAALARGGAALWPDLTAREEASP